jgi:hypothetical protein
MGASGAIATGFGADKYGWRTNSVQFSDEAIESHSPAADVVDICS